MIGPFLRLQPPRTVAAVARLRRDCAAWARTCGVNDTTIDDLSLVVSELATNAVRHGSGARMRLVVARIGDTIDLRIDDDGPPSDPPDAPDGAGRGLAIVRALARELTLDQGPAGTSVHVRLRILPDTAPPAGAATLPRDQGP
ncbi:MAG TPA: ATP-binding protein [Egicoccus sp.]|nr:ATP-binding protein [Egicoccus sp.]HSK22198.1 ATP-binding protein [Egicoccus sp.]